MELGLAPYASPLELFEHADRILVCTSPSYDFGAGTAPSNVSYVGPQFEEAAPGAWDDPWAGLAPKPLVLVGLSSTFMDQRHLLQRAADALGGCPSTACSPPVRPSTRPRSSPHPTWWSPAGCGTPTSSPTVRRW